MKFSNKAILLGTVAYILIYVVHVLLLPLLVNPETMSKESAGVFYFIHQFIGLCSLLLAGFIAARVAGENGFLHGFVVGMGGTIVTLLAAVLWAKVGGAPQPPVDTLPFWLLVNGFLAAFGGLIAANMKAEPAAKPQDPSKTSKMM